MIDEAVRHFKRGDIVIFPTDTLYGVGCVIDNSLSIKRLYKIRKTPLSKPTLILATDPAQAFNYGDFNANARKLVARFWPGPLTIIVKAKKVVPKMIQPKDGTIGIRVPNQPTIRAIVERLGKPILAPSANFHNKPAPTRYNEIDKKLIALVDYAIDLSDLEDGRELPKESSTLIDLTKKNFKLVRSGVISKEDIHKALGGLRK